MLLGEDKHSLSDPLTLNTDWEDSPALGSVSDGQGLEESLSRRERAGG